jgi:ABC-2 type transport system permease protein
VINTLRSEWIKLRTVRMNFVLVILAIAFPLVITVLTALLIDNSDMNTQDMFDMIRTTVVITAMLLGVIGATAITSEFGFGTIRPTFAATPKRARVMIAKAIMTVFVALVVTALVVALCYGLGSGILNGRDGSIALDQVQDGKLALIGVALYAGIISLLGYGLGLLTRSSPVAVAVLILWPLVAEFLVAALLSVAGLDNALDWMPYQAGGQLMSLGDELRGDTFSRLTGGLYFFAVAAAVAMLGAVITNRRDA